MALALQASLLLVGTPQGHATPAPLAPAAKVKARCAPRHPSLRAARRVYTPPTLGAKIVAFARAEQGRQVGTGECYDLADSALQQAGARSAPAYGPVTEDADYVWGKPIALKDAAAGDVLQFRDYLIRTTYIQASGDGAGSRNWEVETRDHHTAIVERNAGNALWILEQNAPPYGRVVQRRALPIASMTVQDETTGMMTTVEVAGIVRAYRPLPQDAK